MGADKSQEEIMSTKVIPECHAFVRIVMPSQILKYLLFINMYILITDPHNPSVL